MLLASIALRVPHDEAKRIALAQIAEQIAASSRAKREFT
jgi:hypothetical protein